LVHGLAAEAVDQAAHADQRRWPVLAAGGWLTLEVGVGGHAHQSMYMNQIAASASNTITSEIVCTTLEVVRSPTDCAVPLTCRPSRQPISPITIANSGALDMPTRKWRSSISWYIRAR